MSRAHFLSLVPIFVLVTALLSETAVAPPPHFRHDATFHAQQARRPKPRPFHTQETESRLMRKLILSAKRGKTHPHVPHIFKKPSLSSSRPTIPISLLRQHPHRAVGKPLSAEYARANILSLQRALKGLSNPTPSRLSATHNKNLFHVMRKSMHNRAQKRTTAALPLTPRSVVHLSQSAGSRKVSTLSLPFVFRGGGLTFDDCVRKKDCKGSRVCMVLGLDVPKPCDGTEKCMCLPRDDTDGACSSRKDCPKGEVCAQFEGEEDSTAPICASKNVVDLGLFPLQEVSDPDDDSDGESKPPSQPSDDESGGGTGDDSGGEADGETGGETDDGAGAESEPSGTAESDSEETLPQVCIDARALSHVESENLIFKKHVWANVLCDDNESCATEGHIVKFRGDSMRMSAYCGIVKCSRRVMQVNSPRYSRGLRVNSNTDGLHFTAFSARYNTRVEEAVLAAVVRAGF